jgi:hypothetical protein
MDREKILKKDWLKTESPSDKKASNQEKIKINEKKDKP